MEPCAVRTGSYSPIFELFHSPKIKLTMKALLLATGFMLALGLGSLNENSTPVPSEERYCAVDGKSVDLKLKVTQVSADQVELALNQGQGKQNVFFQFLYPFRKNL